MRLGLLFAQTLGQAENLSTFDPASPSATWIRDLALFALAVVALIFLVVEGVLIYSMIRFRRKPATEDNEPPQVYGSIPIEIAWTVGPLLIVFLLVLVVIRTEWDVRDETPPPGAEPLRVTVIGHQWWWEYRYTSFGDAELSFVTANELHVPVSEPGSPPTAVKRPVYFTLESVDVAHSFWVPRLAGKTDLIPNRVNRTWFQTETPDLYLGQCAEFCGDQHANMLLRVEVQPVEEFREWLANQQKPANDTDLSSEAKAGRDVFLKEACVNCHLIRGTAADTIFGKSKDPSRYGPDLTHVASRKTIGSGILPRTPENLFAWIKNPDQFKPGVRMPAMNLSDDQIKKIVAYLEALD